MANHSHHAHASHSGHAPADHTHGTPPGAGHAGHDDTENTENTRDTDDAALAEHLDLSAEVLRAHRDEVVGWLDELVGDRRPHRILDVGSGTGSGTFTLLRQFTGAHVTAVDSSPTMLHILRERARAHGMADRVHTVQADLDETWPSVGTPDLVWASASLHHLGDPDRALAELSSVLRPGGLLVVTEADSFLPRFLPDDAGPGAPGLEARCHAALAEFQAQHVPEMGSDWGARLAGAGFAIRAERPFVIDLAPPLPEAAGRFALATLGRIRSALDEQLSVEDLTALDALTDENGPDSVLNRPDLTVRTARTVWVATLP
ncbi:class I SAM-dependent methyltransferase [Streptomyces sp. TS71-3]|uniref:class I SAM-dependent methyltransferase n=1 Tax=Streptomyces sp. TS71-3 TaxID=2733862 RepID=UPI001B2F3461|nr:class I SAM-dependent methyltransferase [Streptomyces sp. TS71-3]GHJ38601.1 hypothetical protein Sm713_42100 [Streptomyces sp. TS71-3]